MLEGLRLCLHEPAVQPRRGLFKGNPGGTKDFAPRGDTTHRSPWKALKMQQVKPRYSVCPRLIGIRAIIKAKKSLSTSYYAATGFICI